MMFSPGEDAPSSFTRPLARSRSTATSIQRSPPLSTLKMSNGGNIASLWLLQTFDSEIEPQGQAPVRSEEHTSELQSRQYLVCRLLLEKKKKHDSLII